MAKVAWSEAQVQALLEAGVDRVDAERIVTWVEKNHGGDVERDPLPEDLTDRMAEVSEADALDAAADWMASPAIPNRYKRLLHARKA
ncbi:hypothetical protein [Nitrobacter sp.]|uniref:hypothetical protein n=1 Tax=Nitrobacter sp. TaxID=29420 RepID=UPI003220251F